MSRTKLGYKATPQPMIVKQGSTLTIKLTFTNPDGSARNMSSKTFTGQVRTLPSSATVSASFSFDMTDAASGIVYASLAGSATAALSVGDSITGQSAQYYYDMRYTESSVDTYFIPMSSLQIEPRVTRS
jgi:hypothetical protein